MQDKDGGRTSVRRGIGGHTSPVRGATDAWITPQPLVTALGAFDLDPCEATPQPWKHALRGITEAEDGLKAKWHGRVWLNPPYSSVWQWMGKLAEHGHGTALIFARTETAGFVEHVWCKASAILFLHGRLHFHYPNGDKAKGNSGGPSCLVAYGDYDAERLLLCGLPGSLVRNPVNRLGKI